MGRKPVNDTPMTPLERQRRHRALRRQEREANAHRLGDYRLELLLRRTLAELRRIDISTSPYGREGCERTIRAIEAMLGIKHSKPSKPQDDIAAPDEIVAEGIARRRGQYKFWRVRRRPEGWWLIEYLGKDQRGRREWRMETQFRSEAKAMEQFPGYAAPLPPGVSPPVGIKSAGYQVPGAMRAEIEAELQRDRADRQKREEREREDQLLRAPVGERPN
jgi:hypothetical protein